MTKGLISQLGEQTLAHFAPLNRIGDEQDLNGAALLFATRENTSPDRCSPSTAAHRLPTEA